MPPRGVSREEKKIRMLAHFTESRSVFSLKELESQLPKSKGIVSQSVKEILIELVSDGLVETDKIGAGNFYWSFPAKMAQKRLRECDDMKEMKKTLKTKGENSEKERAEEKKERNQPGREGKLKLLEEINKKITHSTTEIDNLTQFDPKKLGDLHVATSKCKESANKWTDNVFCILKYLKSKNDSLEIPQLLKQFDLPMDMDNIE